MKFSIIICCYDEEPIIEKSWEKLKEALKDYNDYEVIFVNDGSTDKTLIKLKEILKNNPDVIKILSYENNKGYGYALKSGINVSKGDYLILMDADMAMEPSKIVNYSHYFINYELLIFSRYLGIRPDYPAHRRIASWFYRRMNQFLFKIKVEDTQSGFLCIKRDILKDIKLECDDFSILMELIVKATRKNIKWQEVGVKFIHNTTSGQTSIFKSGPKMLKNSLRLKKVLKGDIMKCKKCGKEDINLTEGLCDNCYDNSGSIDGE